MGALLIGLSLPGAVSAAADEAEEGVLKVVTWNIRHGNGRLRRQREQLAEMDADICFLQEVDEGTGRIGGYSCLKTLGRSLYSNRYLGDCRDYDGGLFGLGILSRKRLAEFDGDTSGEALDVGHVRGVLIKDGTAVSVYNVHLSAEDEQLRLEQLEALAAEFLADENPCRIAAGDFNLRDLDELDIFAGMGLVSTEETPFPTYQGLDCETQAIDNIIYTPGTLRLTGAEMTVSGNSDHNALSAVFEMVGE